MWWDPDDPRALDVSAGLDRLELLPEADDLVGYGVVVEAGSVRPWVVVDPEYDPRAEQWCPGRGPVRRFLRRLIRGARRVPPPPDWFERPSPEGAAAETAAEQDRPVDHAGVPLSLILTEWFAAVTRARHRPNDRIASGIIVPVARADARTRALLAGADVPVPAYVSYWAKGRLTRGACAVGRDGSNSFATAGISLSTAAGEELVTTVGHLGASAGDVVSFFGLRRFGRRRLRCRGTVVAVVERVGGMVGLTSDRLHGKVDLALLKTSDADVTRAGDLVVVAPPAAVVDFEYFGWVGARSERAEQMLLGALRTVQMGDLRLAHCWTLVGGSAPGDSGAGVFRSDSNQFLGHVIGTVGRLSGNGRRETTVVQDGQLLLDAVAERAQGPVVDLRRIVLSES